MATIEKVSIALPAELLTLVKQAVDTGDYASNSEVVREALRQWKARRAGATLPVEATASTAVTSAGPGRQKSAASAADGLALVQSHRRALTVLCRRFRVRKLHVFGSALRADFDLARSDLDVSVDFGKPKGMTPERQYVDFKSALESLFGRAVDVVELAAMPESRLKRLIERSQVAVYEQAA